jgi:hypothetical protein
MPAEYESAMHDDFNMHLHYRHQEGATTCMVSIRAPGLYDCAIVAVGETHIHAKRFAGDEQVAVKIPIHEVLSLFKAAVLNKQLQSLQ